MTRMGEHRSKLQTAASVLLIVLMVLGTVGVIGAIFGDLKKAEAATAGDYRIFIGIQVTNGSGSEHEEDLYVKVTYDKKDGTGSAQTGDLLDHNACWGSDEWSNHYANIDTMIPGFPTRIDVCVNMKGVGFASLDTDALTLYVQSIKLYNYKTNQWAMLWEGSVKFDSSKLEYKAHWDREGHHNDNRTEREWETYTPYYGNWDSKPAANYVVVSGPDSVSVNTNGSTTNYSSSAYSAVVKDQWGVNWREDPTGLVIDSNSYGITLSSNKVAVPATANRSSDYYVTVRGNYGNNISGTKSVLIKTFDYKVTFYDENGTTVLKAEQTVDYGASATAPSNPTKEADDTKHYTFAGWTGDGYTNITSGAQTKTVKASYTGTNHSFGDWFDDTATCEAGGTHKHTCSVCNKTVTANSAALGHTPVHHAAVAATCTTAGNIEYWQCSRCHKYFSNSNCTTQITQASTVIAKKDHSYTGAVRDNNDGTHSFKCVNGCNQYGGTVSCNYGDWGADSATCLEGGTHSHTCQTCGHVASEATQPLGHNYQFTRTVAPTCTEQGYDIYTCSRCGATENRNYTAALNHNYGAWTYLNEDQHQRVCANDASHTEQENHSYGDWIDQNNGTKICTCAGCGHQKTMYIGYSVTFDGNGATSGSMSPQGFTYGTAQNLTANAFGRAYTVTFSDDGATTAETATAAFEGWATAADGAKVYDDEESVNNLTTVENGEVPLYAVWTLGSVTLPTPTKAGYAFGGWYLEDTFESQVAGDTFIPTANTTLYAKWTQVALNDTFILSSNRATKLNVLGNDIPGATLTTVTGGTGFTVAKTTDNKVLFTPGGEMNDAVTFTYTASYNGTTGTATVTVVPASNVYYEESGFITFADGTAAWQDAGREYSGVFEEGMRPGEAGSPMSAYESTDETTSETTYSMGNAKYVTVKKGDTGATATFTFTGTGFDFYAATTNKAGLALVDIYKVENGTETDLESTLINTYFGYEYGPLYLDANNTVTLEEEGNAPIWFTDDTGAGTFFINGTRRGTTAETAGAKQAYGWVATKAEGEDGLYQVPVISYTDLPYGTYKVVIEPRYSARQDLTGDGQYKFYVDAVRVYDPVDPDNITTGTAVYDAYALDRELNATYQSVRDLLIDPNNGGVATDGVAFLDLGAASESIDLAKYADVGPKNEVYLNPGQAIAFNMETVSAAQPAKVCIGLKMVRGESGTVQIASAGTQTVTVTGATDIYHEITGAVAWAPTGKDGAYKTTSAIIVTNTSGAGKAISITKLKWSYDTATVAGANTMSFSFAPQDLVTAKAVAQSIRLPQPTADAAGVVLRWSKASYNEGETATLTITAPSSFVKAFVDGAELTDYTETADGLRQWTYTFIARSSGTFSYDVTLEDGATARRTGTLPTSVTVAAGQSGANTNTNNGRRMLTLRALLQKLAERLMQVFKLSFVKGTVK